MTSSIHLGSLDTKILYFEPFQKFLSHPSVSLSSFINLVAKVTIFIKLIMYGCLLNSYKAFFHLHTWLCMSCDFTSSSCKYFFIVYAFFSWEASCYKSCFVSHDVSIYCMMELWTSLPVSILRFDIILLKLVFPFFMVDGRFYINDVTTLIILFFVFEISSLVLQNKSSFFFACRWLCMRSFLQVKWNCMVITFHKEYSYWKIIMHKYMIMQLF